jgi:hypothetical protein
MAARKKAAGRKKAGRTKAGRKKVAAGGMIISKSRVKAAATKCNVGATFYDALEDRVREAGGPVGVRRLSRVRALLLLRRDYRECRNRAELRGLARFEQRTDRGRGWGGLTRPRVASSCAKLKLLSHHHGVCTRPCIRGTIRRAVRLRRRK